jgi:putative SOS response-associated peptidase YedK
VCGRIASWRAPADLAAWFGAEQVVGEPLPARYNVAPSDEVYAVAETSRGRRLGTMSWGLVPSWSPDPSAGPRPINARRESLLDKAMFAESLRRRRCLVPADGFYEWTKGGRGGTRQPYFIAARDGAPLALAGLWDRWTGPDGSGVVSVVLVTTPANPVVAPLHDRMPAILPEQAWDTWLAPTTGDSATLLALLQPAPADLLEARPASRRVNSVANEGPDLLDAVDGEAAGRLPF